jgi:hypothetical protein
LSMTEIRSRHESYLDVHREQFEQRSIEGTSHPSQLSTEHTPGAI